MISLPNVVSFARLLSVPLVIWLMISGRLTAAFWVFMAAGLSDAIDGFLAKRFDARTELGAYLDPLADKALLVATYATLGWIGHLPVWLVILVIFRDVLIIGGALVVHALMHTFKSRPMMISKVNTAAQIALVTLVLAKLALGFDDFEASQALVWVVAVTTVWSGFAYLVHWGRKLAHVEDQQ